MKISGDRGVSLLGTCKTRPRKKRGGALRARYQTALPPRRTASKTLPKKFIALTLLLRSTAHPRESRSDARPRSRAGGRSPQRRKQPRASRSPQPKAFPTRNNFATPEGSLLLLLSLSPNIRTLLPVLPPLPPQVSQTTCPPTKSVSNPKRVCQPGSFAPPPHNLIASPPPPPPFAVCQALSERPRPVYSARLSV